MFDRLNGPMLRTAYNVLDPSATITMGALIQNGVIPSARLNFATDASNADVITIGGKTFKFLTTLIPPDNTVQVKRGTSAAMTLAALIKAINGVASPGDWVESLTPFAVPIVADAPTATVLRIRNAVTRAGAPVAGVSGSVALTSSLTPPASIWNCANLNVSGKDPANCKAALFRVAVTAQMITNGSYQIELPFTPTVVQSFVTSAAGVQRASTDAVTISGNAVNIALGGGASPAIQSTDIVTVLVVE